jgi:hypothetical protein
VIAAPKVAPAPETEEGAPPQAKDLAGVLGEARRDIG